MKKHIPSVLRNKNFVYLWGSQQISEIAINVMNFLILIYLFEETGSSITSSFVWITYALPAILVGPIAAAMVDLVDRKKVLMITNLMQALIIFFYSFTFHSYIYLAYLVVFAYSIFNQFYVPAEAASLPRLVKKENYPEANGLFFMTEQTGVVLGMGVVGLMREVIGFKVSFLASSLLLFIGFILVSRLPKLNTAKNIKGFENSMQVFLEGFVEGYKYIRERRSIMLAYLLLMTMYISMTTLGILLPKIAQDLLHVSGSTALLVVFPAGFGAAIGSVAVSKMLRRKKRKKSIIQWSLLLLSVSIWSATATIPHVEGVARLVLTSMAFVVLGGSFIGVLMPAQTFLQEVTEERMYGRVFGNFWLLATAFSIIPVFSAAYIADIFGINLVLYIIGSVGVVGFIVARKYFAHAIGYIK